MPSAGRSSWRAATKLDPEPQKGSRIRLLRGQNASTSGAWPTARGDGFNVQIPPGIAVSGNLVLVPKKESQR